MRCENSCHGHSTVSQCVHRRALGVCLKRRWAIQRADVLDPGTKVQRMATRSQSVPPLRHRPHTFTYTARRVLADLDPCLVSLYTFPLFDIVCSAISHRHIVDALYWYRSCRECNSIHLNADPLGAVVPSSSIDAKALPGCFGVAGNKSSATNVMLTRIYSHTFNSWWLSRGAKPERQETKSQQPLCQWLRFPMAAAIRMGH